MTIPAPAVPTTTVMRVAEKRKESAVVFRPIIYDSTPAMPSGITVSSPDRHIPTLRPVIAVATAAQDDNGWALPPLFPQWQFWQLDSPRLRRCSPIACSRD